MKNFPFPHRLPCAVRAALALGCAAALSGCMSLTGLGGETEFSCPRADGLHCADLESVFRASRDGRLPQQQAEAERLAAEAAQTQRDLERRSMGLIPSAPMLDAAGSALKTEDGVVRVGSAEPPASEHQPKTENAAVSAALGESAADDPRAAYAKAFGSSGTGASGFAPRAEDPSAMLPGLEYFASPKRMPEKLVRLWIAPYTDDDGDLHDAHALYIRLEDARWATASRRKAQGPAVVPLPFGSGAPALGATQDRATSASDKGSGDPASGADALKEARERMKAFLPAGAQR